MFLAAKISSYLPLELDTLGKKKKKSKKTTIFMVVFLLFFTLQFCK